MKRTDLHQQLIAQLTSEGVDLDRLIRFINDLNDGKFDNLPEFVPYSVPEITNPAIFDRCKPAVWTMPYNEARSRFDFLEIPLNPDSLGIILNGNITFDEAALKKSASIYIRKLLTGYSTEGLHQHTPM
ncbi:hypothetical protein K7I13_05120 [Brucepastera parasyntrophica]|uniref:hypothetical protein n=1 Tax=Brucepastera parasyntrophica TaxID=2880008 RepID=UPI00210D535A|nr:hypothetical protein [Brucepastera parasyntrophica]ULQ60656.1 hypothetical protein K7I13_05120 [Brucepastera parasyntrophica]